MPESNQQPDYGLLRINYDPAHPKLEHFTSAMAFAAALSAPSRTRPVPWPADATPVPAPLTPPPLETDALPKADVLLVTWTVAEAQAMATLLTPGVPIESWYEYRRKVSDYIPKVTGFPRKLPPFNDPKHPRYYHSLGIYYLTQLRGKRVLCFKSGLHMDYDGPALPLRDLWNQLLDEVAPSHVVTTGTGGGIGANVLLGDVVVAKHTRFDCTTNFVQQPFAQSSYATSRLPGKLTAPMTDAILKPNAVRIVESGAPTHPDKRPVFFFDGNAAIADPTIVSTDFFAFDTTTNDARLQGLGNVCDMGDAVLGLVLQTRTTPPAWYAIRNASDPQIDGSLPPEQRSKEAYNYYTHFGPFTSANSVIACWSLIYQLFPADAAPKLAAKPEAAFLSGATLPTPGIAGPTPDVNETLLQIAGGTKYENRPVQAADLPSATTAALGAYLTGINVDLDTATIEYRQLTFVDSWAKRQTLYFADVSYDGPEVFRGTYLYSGQQQVAKKEFVSS